MKDNRKPETMADVRRAEEEGGKPPNRRDEVIAAVRATLPEFFERNASHGAKASELVMDNLAGWISTVIPPGVARAGCPGPQTRAEREAMPPYLCGCTGHCLAWIDAETWPRE